MNRFASLTLSLVLLNACVSTSPQSRDVHPGVQETLTIFAGAGLTEAFNEIATTFETTHPGVDVRLNLAGSNTLRAQIELGAEADVFASANMKEMDALVAGNFVQTGIPKIFLTNQLVVITPADNPAGILALDDLARPGIKLVLAAEEVPVGEYARLMLKNAGDRFKTQVLANVVSNETTVRQVVAKVLLGEADAGIVYASDTVATPELHVIEIPDEFNVLASFYIAPLANSAQPELADEFIAFVLSPKGQDILKKWGFTPYDSLNDLEGTE